jgi:hypothetical protein
MFLDRGAGEDAYVPQFEWPVFRPNSRVGDKQLRARMSEEARRLYEDEGRSIREITVICGGRSVGFVRSLLTDAGVDFRPKGGRRKA